MKEHIILQNINTIYVQATSFPNGVKAAHEQLHSKISASEGRRFFGISYPDEKGQIIYRAAVEELHYGEAANLKLDTFTIRKGKYISEILKDWTVNERKVGELFQQLLHYPAVVKDGYCLEEYINDRDMLLMVTIE